MTTLEQVLNFLRNIDSTLSGLEALLESTQGSREEAATLGWMMECFQHSQTTSAKGHNKTQCITGHRFLLALLPER
jgi:hypothetical protein